MQQNRLRGLHGQLQIAKTGLDQLRGSRDALTSQLHARLDALDSRLSAAIGQRQASSAYDVGTVGGPGVTTPTPAPGAPTPPVVTDPAAAITIPTSTGRYTVKGTSTPNLLAEVWTAAPTSSTASPAKSSSATAPLVTQRVGGDGTFGVDVSLGAGAGQPNLFVVTTYDPTQQLESPPTAVPPITTQAAPNAPVVTGVPSSGVTAPVSATTYTITGTSTPNLLAEVWRAAASSTAQAPAKDPNATGPLVTQRVGSNGTFGMDVPLAAPPGQPNLFVVTTFDPSANAESTPVAVPPITVPPASAPPTPTVTVPNQALTLPSGTPRFAIQGVTKPALLARVWLAAAATPASKDPNATVPVATVVAAADGTYSAEVNLTGGQANLFVVTAYDPGSQLESAPVQVPAITVGTVTPVPAAPVITDPSAGVQLGSGANRYQIKASGAPNLQIWIYQADPTSTPASPLKLSGSTPVATSMIGGNGTVSVEANLVASAGQPNLFVATVYDAQNKIESAAAYVPPITVQASSGSSSSGTSAPGSSPAAPGSSSAASAATSSATSPAPTPVPPVAALPAPTITRPPIGSQQSVPVGTTTYGIRGSFPSAAPQGTLISVYRTDASGQIASNSTLAGSTELLPGDTTFTINVFLDLTATNYFAVNAKDNASTAPASPASSLITILSPPAAPVLKDLAATREDETTDYEMSGTSQPNTMVQVFPAANGAKKSRAAALASDKLSGDQTNFSVKFALPTEDMPSQLAVTATDASGNESSPTIVPLVAPAPPPSPLKPPSTRLVYAVFDELVEKRSRRTQDGAFYLEDVREILRTYNRAPISSQDLRKYFRTWQASLRERE